MRTEAGAGQLPDAGEVREVMREILAGPEFATLPENPMAMLMAWVLEKFRDLWFWLRELLGEQTGVAALATLLIVGAVVAIVAVLARRHAPALLRKRGASDTAEGEFEIPVTARQWLNLAGERAGRGELRPAATALYQGFLLSLDGREVLSFHESKTPGDYRGELARGGGGGVVAGTRFLDSFQDFSFGPDRPTATGYDGLARLARDAGCAVAGPAGDSGGRREGSGHGDPAAGGAGGGGGSP